MINIVRSVTEAPGVGQLQLDDSMLRLEMMCKGTADHKPWLQWGNDWKSNGCRSFFREERKIFFFLIPEQLSSFTLIDMSVTVFFSFHKSNGSSLDTRELMSQMLTCWSFT